MKLQHIITESKGISHIEDLAIAEFIDSLRNFDQFELSEKVDGSNIHFGIDQTGFYTTREHIGGKRIHSVDEYDIDFHTTFQRAAHLALQRVLPIMVECGLSVGDRIEAEVLFGVIPNIIRYNEEVNQIILLRVVEGYTNLDRLNERILNEIIPIKLDTPYTLDGKTIQTESREYIFSFEKVPTIDTDSFSKSETAALINKELDDLEDFLSEPSGILNFSNIEVLSLPLNKRPPEVQQIDWQEIKTEIQDKREILKTDMYHFDPDTNISSGYKYRIKELLLNKLVRTISSNFGPEVKDGGWIEGVVFRNKLNGKQFKVVDKDLFTIAKDFLWHVRQDLTDKPRTVSSVNSFVGTLLNGLASSIGHPELATTQAKRYLRRFGDEPDDILDTIPLNFDVNSVREYWISFLDEKKDELEDILLEYKNGKDGKKLDISLGGHNKTFTYDAEINNRTLQSFSKIFKDIETFKQKAHRATEAKDFVISLVGHQLSSI